ncbi:hypothetical protein PR048_008938 [Dryococelus australis]|uniref:Uncharacterized protein n=1 Tax=Dryococelus australis TaxID=614101 RepID=A0ABQ9HYI7_9NEOP|nr:hypothetical protein PR048_008938 [Dryococelus australis]
MTSRRVPAAAGCGRGQGCVCRGVLVVAGDGPAVNYSYDRHTSVRPFHWPTLMSAGRLIVLSLATIPPQQRVSSLCNLRSPAIITASVTHIVHSRSIKWMRFSQICGFCRFQVTVLESIRVPKTNCDIDSTDSMLPHRSLTADVAGAETSYCADSSQVVFRPNAESTHVSEHPCHGRDSNPEPPAPQIGGAQPTASREISANMSRLRHSSMRRQAALGAGALAYYGNLPTLWTTSVLHLIVRLGALYTAVYSCKRLSVTSCIAHRGRATPNTYSGTFVTIPANASRKELILTIFKQIDDRALRAIARKQMEKGYSNESWLVNQPTVLWAWNSEADKVAVCCAVRIKVFLLFNDCVLLFEVQCVARMGHENPAIDYSRKRSCTVATAQQPAIDQLRECRLSTSYRVRCGGHATSRTRNEVNVDIVSSSMYSREHGGLARYCAGSRADKRVSVLPQFLLTSTAASPQAEDSRALRESCRRLPNSSETSRRPPAAQAHKPPRLPFKIHCPINGYIILLDNYYKTLCKIRITTGSATSSAANKWTLFDISNNSSRLSRETTTFGNIPLNGSSNIEDPFSDQAEGDISSMSLAASFQSLLKCRTKPLFGGFSRGSPISPALSFRRCSILISITLIGSEDLDFSSICEQYASYLINHYGANSAVVFDGYEDLNSTKCTKQKWRGTS